MIEAGSTLLISMISRTDCPDPEKGTTGVEGPLYKTLVKKGATQKEFYDKFNINPEKLKVLLLFQEKIGGLNPYKIVECLRKELPCVEIYERLLKTKNMKDLDLVFDELKNIFELSETRAITTRAEKIFILVTGGTPETFYSLITLTQCLVIGKISKISIIRHPEFFNSKLSKIKYNRLPLFTSLYEPPVESIETYIQDVQGLKLQELRHYIHQRETIFLYGPTGTGKTHLFDEISRGYEDKKIRYSFALKGEDPMIAKHELFGYEEGAYTGAKKGGSRGYLHRVCDGGIIFFDELNRASEQNLALIHDLLSEKQFPDQSNFEKMKEFNGNIVLGGNIHPLDMVKKKMMPEDFYERITKVFEFKAFSKMDARSLGIILELCYQNLKSNDVIKFPFSKEGKDVLVKRLEGKDIPGNFRSLEKMLKQMEYFFSGITKEKRQEKSGVWVEEFLDPENMDRDLREIFFVPKSETNLFQPLDAFFEVYRKKGSKGQMTLEQAIRSWAVDKVKIKGVKKVEVASCCGRSVQTVSNWEKDGIKE